MPKWVISRVDGLSSETVGELPSNMTEAEVSAVLQRLACRHLSDNEIIGSSFRRGAKDRLTLLDRVGSGKPLSFGQSPGCYTADRED